MKYFPPPIHPYGFSNAPKYTDFASSSEISISIKMVERIFRFLEWDRHKRKNKANSDLWYTWQNQK